MVDPTGGPFNFNNEKRYNCEVAKRKIKLIVIKYVNGRYVYFDSGDYAQRDNVMLDGRTITHDHGGVWQVMRLVNFLTNGRYVFEHSGRGVNIYCNGLRVSRYDQVDNVQQCHDILYQRLGILVFGGPGDMANNDPRDIDSIVYRKVK